MCKAGHEECPIRLVAAQYTPNAAGFVIQEDNLQSKIHCVDPGPSLNVKSTPPSESKMLQVIVLHAYRCRPD